MLDVLRLAILTSAAAGSLLLGLSSGQAALITFTANGTGSDGSLSASAEFMTSAGHVDVTLTNLLGANVIRSAGQALSDITFTLSNLAGTVGATTASGQLGNFSDTGGIVTYTSGSPARWLGAGGQGQFSVVGNTVTLEAIGGGQPSQMIIPFQTNGGVYSNVNNGFDNFEPYTIGPATFGLNLSGVTAATTITSTIFSFGTGPDTFLPGTSIPEPASLAIFGTALAGLGLLGRRRRKNRS